jgi:hypothetical protein
MNVKQQPTYTSVEILTFNISKNRAVLENVLKGLKKEADLIVVCLQESPMSFDCIALMSKVLPDYECKDHASHGFPVAGYTQLFMLQKRGITDVFELQHETMRFSMIDRPWKGAIFMKCESKVFRRPFVFVGAHFHAHEGKCYEGRRKQDFSEIYTKLFHHYYDCDWALFGDLNFRNDSGGSDEFDPYFNVYKIREHEWNSGNTFKVDLKDAEKFDQKRIPSHTDRIVHNMRRDEEDYEVRIDEYGTADPQNTQAPHSDHKAVYECFEIMHGFQTASLAKHKVALGFFGAKVRVMSVVDGCTACVTEK